MAPLDPDQFLGVLVTRLHAASVHPAPGGFDGRQAMPLWLAEAARDQAARVFGALDTFLDAPGGREGFMAFARKAWGHLVEGWERAMAALRSVGEAWAEEAVKASAVAFEGALEDLMLDALTIGGRA